MMSKSKNCNIGWETLHRSRIERLAFYYDRHEEITRYIQIRDMHYHPVVMHVFCVPLNFLAGFVIPDAIQYNLILTL